MLVFCRYEECFPLGKTVPAVMICMPPRQPPICSASPGPVLPSPPLVPAASEISRAIRRAVSNAATLSRRCHSKLNPIQPGPWSHARHCSPLIAPFRPPAIREGSHCAGSMSERAYSRGREHSKRRRRERRRSRCCPNLTADSSYSSTVRPISMSVCERERQRD